MASNEPAAPPTSAHVVLAGATAGLAAGALECAFALAEARSPLHLLAGRDRVLATAAILASASAAGLLGGLLLLVALRRRRTAAPRAAASLAFALPAFEALGRVDDVRGYTIAAFAGAATLLAAAVWIPRPRGLPALLRLVAPVAAALVLALAFLGAPEGVEAHLPAGESSGGPPPAPSGPPRRPNLLVLLVDTLRADHLSCYGYPRSTSPNIDELARRGVLFERALTPQPKTSPAVASLFTGLYPCQHRVRLTSTRLPAEHVTLAERLRSLGYHTFAVSTNVNVAALYGFDQGFDEFVSIRRRLADGRRVEKHAGRVRAQVEAWLRELAEDPARRPFFLYAHFLDPHSPYRPPRRLLDRFLGDRWDGRLGTRELPILEDDYVDGLHRRIHLPEVGFDLDEYVARYDAEIAYADEQIGALLETLEGLGLADDTIVVFTADHGESMTEHDTYFNHGLFPYQEQVHIPLIVAGPGVASGERRERPVSLCGLATTLLDLAGSAPDPALPEPSFASSLTPRGGEPALVPIPLFAQGRGRSTVGLLLWPLVLHRRDRGIEPTELLGPPVLDPGRRIERSLTAAHPFSVRRELYDLSTDPRETRNLAYRAPRLRERLERRLDERLSSLPPVGPPPLRLERHQVEEEVARELEEMGYLGGN